MLQLSVTRAIPSSAPRLSLDILLDEEVRLVLGDSFRDLAVAGGVGEVRAAAYCREIVPVPRIALAADAALSTVNVRRCCLLPERSCHAHKETTGRSRVSLTPSGGLTRSGRFGGAHDDRGRRREQDTFNVSIHVACDRKHLVRFASGATAGLQCDDRRHVAGLVLERRVVQHQLLALCPADFQRRLQAVARQRRLEDGPHLISDPAR